MKIIIYLMIVAFLATGCSNDSEEKQKTLTTKQNTNVKKITPNIHTSKQSKQAFKQAFKLNHDEEDIHILGRSFFTIPWSQAPSVTTARDGLGPLYSANTCIHCHPNNGAGTPMKNGFISRSLVMRLSIPNTQNMDDDLIEKNGFVPEPTYGGQLSLHSNTNTPFEGRISLNYKNIILKYEDNSTCKIQKPTYSINKLQYGEFDKNVNIAPHIGLALIGLGAIEMIEEKDILAKEDIYDKDKDGISGKANWVYNPESNTTELGRFTWKAAAATVKQQAANAAHNDMSLSNPIYPGDNCTDKQVECLKANQGIHDFDLPMYRLDAIAFYLKTLRIPRERKTANFAKGKKIFNSLGCVKCHTSEYKLSDGNTIKPYSDFLLHDMGDALSDGHTMFKASANEFRTPPLWSMGLYEKASGKMALLHDGRARNIEEAILWHGGESTSQQGAFKALNKQDRNYLIEFLKGI